MTVTVTCENCGRPLDSGYYPGSDCDTCNWREAIGGRGEGLTLSREQVARIAHEADEFEADTVTLDAAVNSLGGISFLLANDEGRCRARFYVSIEGEVG